MAVPTETTTSPRGRLVPTGSDSVDDPVSPSLCPYRSVVPRVTLVGRVGSLGLQSPAGSVPRGFPRYLRARPGETETSVGSSLSRFLVHSGTSPRYPPPEGRGLLFQTTDGNSLVKQGLPFCFVIVSRDPFSTRVTMRWSLSLT